MFSTLRAQRAFSLNWCLIMFRQLIGLILYVILLIIAVIAGFDKDYDFATVCLAWAILVKLNME